MYADVLEAPIWKVKTVIECEWPLINVSSEDQEKRY